MAHKNTGSVIRRAEGRTNYGSASVTSVALTVKACDGSIKTIIGMTWQYPDLAVAQIGDSVSYEYGDTVGLSKFSIDHHSAQVRFTSPL